MAPSGIQDALVSTRRTVAGLARDGRLGILTTIALGWFLGLGIRLAAPALIPYIRTEFGMGLSTAGLLLSTLWVAYALLQLPGGTLADRIGERAVLVGSCVLATLALVASALAWSPLALFGGFVLLGAATGTYATTRFTALTDLFPERAATAIGLSSAAGNAGTVLLPAGAGLLAAAASWRMGFAGVIPLFGLAAVGLWITVPPYTATSESAVDELSVATLRRLAAGLATRRVLALTVAMFLMSFVYQGFTSFYPTYLVARKGLSEGTAAILYSTFFAAGILAQPLGGAVADAVGDRLTLVAYATTGAVALFLVQTVSGFWPLAAVSVLMSGQLAFWPVAQAGAIDALPADMAGTGFGLLRTVYLLFAATAPAVVGALGDRGAFDEAFLLLSGFALVGALAGLVLWPDAGAGEAGT